MALSLTRGRVRRRPEDQDAEVLFDVVELVLDAGCDEDQAAGFDRTIFAGNADLPAAADHVVDLVLFVRPLAIGRAGRPYGQADAELLRAQEIDVAVSIGVARLGIQFGYLVRFHGKPR
jgi:hypothetical protein